MGHLFNCKVKILIVVCGLFQWVLCALDYNNFEEGKCDGGESLPVWPMIKTPELLAANSKQGWRVPLSSKHMAYQLGEQLKGRPLKSNQELKAACVKAKLKGLAGRIVGFGKEIIYSCSIKGRGAAECQSTNKSERKGDGRWFVGWTDNKNHILIIRCLRKSNQKDWALLSTESVINSSTRKKVLKYLEKLKFNRNNTIEISYDNC